MLEVVFTCRLLLGTVFILSSLSKTRSLERFAWTIDDVARLAGLRLRGLAPMFSAGFIVGTEMTLGALFVGGVLLTAASLGAIALLAAFAVVSALTMRSSVAIQCNCFGEGQGRLGIETLIRASLLAPAAALVLWASLRHDASGIPTGGAAFASCAMIAVGWSVAIQWIAHADTFAAAVRERREAESELELAEAEASAVQGVAAVS